MHRKTAAWAIVVGALGGVLGAWWGLDPAEPGEAPVDAARAESLPASAEGSRFLPPQRAALALETTVEVVRAGSPVPSAAVTAWHSPASGATVREWQALGSAITGAGGTVALTLPPGTTLLSVEAPETPPLLHRATLTPGDPSPRVRIELPPSLMLEGRVLRDDTRAPVPRAFVRFSPTGLDLDPELPVPPRLAAATQADGLGGWSLATARPPRGVLRASAPGSVPVTLTLDERSTAAELDLVLTAAGRVDGTVTDAAGRPLAGAPVRAMPTVGLVATTDASGRFALDVPPGAVTLDAEGPTGRHALERVTVSTEAPTRGVRLVVRDGVSLEGVVTRAGTMEPVAGADVVLSSEPDGLELGHTTSAADGAFHFAAVPEGRWQLRAWLGGGRRGTAVGVELPLAAPVHLELRDAAQVSGFVVDARGVGQSGAEVRLAWNPRLGEPPRWAHSDASGRFSFDDVFPGEVLATATLDDASSRMTRQWVGAEHPAELRLVLVGRGRLRGHVDGAGGPATVLVMDDAENRRVTTSAEGDFELSLPEGRYGLLATRPRAEVWLSGHTGVNIVAGQTAEVRLVIQEEQGGETERSLRSAGPEAGVSFENGPGGVAISWLTSDSPAFEAGLRVGDLVQSLDGAPVTSAVDAFPIARGHDGQSVAWVVRRGGQDRSFTVSRR